MRLYQTLLIGGLALASVLSGCSQDFKVNRPAFRISGTDFQNLKGTVSLYQEIKSVGRNTPNISDDIPLNHQHALTYLSKFYGRENVVAEYNRIRTAEQEPIVYYNYPFFDSTTALLASALKCGYDETIEMYNNIKTQSKMPCIHRALLTKTALEYGLNETIQMYKQLENLDKDPISGDYVSFVDTAPLTQTGLKYGFDKTIAMYKQVRNLSKDSSSRSYIPFGRIAFLTEVALECGLENTVNIYTEINEKNRDIFPACYSIPYNDLPIFVNVSSKIGLDRLLTIYDELQTTGGDTYSSSDDIPREHLAMLTLATLSNNPNREIASRVDDALFLALLCYVLF